VSGSSSKVTVGFQYYLGNHLGLCQGPIDKITRLRWDERVAWQGESTGGSITVDAPELFGGEKREGGISGTLQFEPGQAAQGFNSYLTSQLGSTVPAFRGIAALVLNQMYLGNNPYLKKMDVRASRIHVRQDGVGQWYDGKSQIGGGVEYPAEWEATQTIWSGGVAVNDLAYCSENNWIAVGSGGRVATSSGNALGWDAYQTILGGADVSRVHSHGGVTLAVGGNGRVSRSTDCGATWSAYQSIAGTSGTGYPGLRSVHFGNGAWVVGADNARLQRSLDGGLTWDLSAFNAVPGASGAVGARWIDTVWIAWSSNASTVFRSTDNAATWSGAITVTGVPHPIAEIKSGNGVTIAISGGSGYMARSLDYGLTWGTAFVPLPDGGGGVTNLLSLDYHDGVWLMAGLRDATGFVARSDDDGATWSEVFPEIGIRTTSMNYANGVWVMSGWSGAVKRLVLEGGDYPGCPDMNPAHIIRECLTDPDWGMGYSESDIDDASFTAAADTLYAEHMGISILWDQQGSIQDFIDLIVKHIDAALYVSNVTGKFVLKLIRADYDPATIMELGEAEIERVEDYSRPATGDLLNQVTVVYSECEP